jgi:hypothetical protein
MELMEQQVVVVIWDGLVLAGWLSLLKMLFLARLNLVY